AVPRNSALRFASFTRRAVSSVRGGRPKAVANICRARCSGEVVPSLSVRSLQCRAMARTKGSFSRASAWSGTLVTARRPVVSFGAAEGQVVPETILGIDGDRFRTGQAALPPGCGGDEQCHQFLVRPALLHEARGEIIEQLRVRRPLAQVPEVIRGAHQPFAEQV